MRGLFSVISNDKERPIFKFLLSGVDLWAVAAVLWGTVFIAFKDEQTARWRRLPLWAALLGSVLGIAEYIYRMSDPKGTNVRLIFFNRYLIVFIAITLLAIVLLNALGARRGRRFDGLFKGLQATAVVAVFFYLVPQALKMTGEFIYFGEDGFSTMALLRVIGFLLAIALAGLLSLGLFKTFKELAAPKYRIYSLLIYLIIAADYFIRMITSLQRLRLVPLNDFVFQTMIIGDNHYRKIIYLLLAVCFIALIDVFMNNRKVVGQFKNSALRRKRKALLRNRRRWAVELAVCILVAVTTLTVVRYYETKEVELAPAEPYQMEENIIIIPLEALADGHLHRFSYITPNGYNVKFIAVKKPRGEAYGLGLDACEICGIAGYFERGDDVVCKRCDVVMNKATIGFKGGCNPIPFPYEIADQKIYIDVNELIREEKRFR